MLVTLKSFGSLWSRRIKKDPEDPHRFVRASYYNTTGIAINGRIQHRWKKGAGGEIKFHGVRSGFDPNYPTRLLNQTFECSNLETWQGHKRLTVEGQIPEVERPNYFLIVVTAEQTGGFPLDEANWKADDVVILSVSEWRDQQEAMLLIPPFSWVRGRLGTFFVELSPNKSLNGLLRLEHPY